MLQKSSLVALLIAFVVLITALGLFRPLFYGPPTSLAVELTAEQSKSISSATRSPSRPPVPETEVGLRATALRQPPRRPIQPLSADNWYPVRQNCKRRWTKWSKSQIVCCVHNFSQPLVLTRQDNRRLTAAGFSSSFIDLLPLDETVLPHYNACAVVSSSSTLLRHEYGAEIDGHDAVFRPNVPPLKGFEKHVGSKTTVRVVNTKVNVDRAAVATGADLADFVFLRDIPSFSLTSEVWRKSLFDPLGKFEQIRKKYPHLKYFLLHPLFDWRFGSILTESLSSLRLNGASTGFFAASVALALCNYISVYEVASGQRNVQDKLCHYYDRRPVGCTAFHPLEFERDLLKMLSYSYTDGERTVYKIKGAHFITEC